MIRRGIFGPGAIHNNIYYLAYGVWIRNDSASFKAMISVLFIDDEPLHLRVAKQLLEATGGIRVDTIGSAKTALLLEEFPRYDAIVSDYEMPGMDGIALLRQIRAAKNPVPFILFTGKGREEIVIQALNEGADFYLQKGGEPRSLFAELAHKIRIAVEKQRQVREIQAKEEELRREVERTSRILEQVADTFFSLDRDGRFTIVNPAAEKAPFARPASDLLGKVIWDLYPALSGTTIQYRFLDAAGKCSLNHFEAGFPLDNRHYEFFVQGYDAGIDVYMRDITERTEALRALRDSERNYREIFNSTSEAIMIDDAETGKIIDVNATTLAMYGYGSREEILAGNIGELSANLPPYGENEAQQRILRCINEGPQVFEWLAKKKSGEHFWTEVSLRKTEIGGEGKILAVCRDITGRKRAEDEIRQSEEKYRILAERTNDGVYIYQGEHFVFTNTKVSQITGYSPEELAAMKFMDIIHPDDRGWIGEIAARRIRNETVPDRYECRIITRDGKIRHMDITISTIRYRGEVAALGSARDVTDRRIMEDSIHALFRSMVGTTGPGSLVTLCRSIGPLFGADCVMIGEIRPDNRSVNVLAMIQDDREVTGVTYSLAGTPCDDVKERGFCLYPDNVRDLFPQAPDLVSLDIRGYAGTPLVNSSGQVIGILCILSRKPLNPDHVTREMMEIFAVKAAAEIERKRVEEALRASEEKYRTLADAAEDIVYIIDHDDRVIYLNRHGLAKLNMLPAEIIGRPRSDLFPKNVADRQRESIRRVFSTGIPFRIESRIPLPDRETWQDTQLVPVRDSGGTITAVMGMSRDITDRKKSEDVLRDNLERYRQILENVNEGILVNELTPRGPGRFLEVNEFACGIIGLSPEELRRVSLVDLSTPDIAERGPAMMAELEKNRHIGFQTRYLPQEGREKVLDINVSLFKIGGRPTMLSVVRDITDQEKTQMALRHANKKLSLLASITRHDIKNQLLGLNAYIALSKESLADPEKTAGFIRHEEDITRAIERQITFTKEYEDLGVHAPVWQNAGDCIGRAEQELDHTGVELDAEPLTGVEILADSLLQKVFFNLIDNSLRHGGDALMRIQFRCRETADGLVIFCEDDGFGIPAGEKDLIFERGYGKNTGFGLFFIREILAITGITIQETGVPGSGARFEILVPDGGYRLVSSQEIPET